MEAVTLDDRSELDGQGSDISAAEVYQLLLGIGLSQKPNKLTLRNARIVGDLDLESAELVIAAEFRQCTFTRMINLEQAKAKAIYFVECGLRGISAGQLQTTFSFVVQNCMDTGGINLSGAHIGGQVSFAETRLNPSNGDPLFADGLVVDQDMRCTDGFLANGQVRLVGAHIGGQFQCEDGTFRNPGQVALEASGLIVDEGVYWQHGFRADGAIRLLGAHIKGELHCDGGRFDDGDIALDFAGLTVDRGITFTAGSVVRGGIDLTGSRIGGDLDLTGGSFHHAGTALDLARVSIAQNLICRTGFEVKGKVLLAGATIGGNLWCEGGKFDNATGAAIDARGMTVGRDVAFSRSADDDGFCANGKVVLMDASIGGSLNCTGGRFISNGDLALTAKGLTVTRDAVFGPGFSTDGEIDIADATIGGNLTCGGRFSRRPMSFKGDRIQIKQSAQFGDGFLAEGTVSLRSAQIGADVEFAKATLAAREQETALTLSGATVGATLRLRFSSPPTGTVDLSTAKVGQLDDRETLWPLEVRLDDFVYGTLPADGPSVRTRLAWLASNSGYVPQTYLQLASVYRAAGSVDESVAVAVAGEDARWAAQSNRFKRIFGLLLKITVLYGYRPLLVLWYLIGLEAVGIGVFMRLHAIGAIRPAGNAAPDFNPYLYTLDLLVPVVSLRQRDFWVPTGVGVWVSAAFTVFGWILALCLAVGVGRIFKTQ